MSKVLRPNPAGDYPQVADSAYLDPKACIIGNVHIGKNVYVGPYAVIRADEPTEHGEVVSIHIGDNCNIQDGVIIHSLRGCGVEIGCRTAVSHGCVIHGPCKIGCDCFVGFKSVVYNAKLADGVFISAGAVVQDTKLTEKSFIHPGQTITGPLHDRIIDKVGDAQKIFMKRVIDMNLHLANGYNKA